MMSAPEVSKKSFFPFEKNTNASWRPPTSSSRKNSLSGLPPVRFFDLFGRGIRRDS